MKRQVFVSALTTTLFTLMITVLLEGAISPVSAQPPLPELALEPGYHFGQELGEEFDVNVTISDVNASDHLVGIHFRLRYDPDLLEVVTVSEGDFLPRFNQTPVPPSVLFMWSTEPNGVFGPHVVVGTILLPNGTGQYPGPFPDGGGLVATITFGIAYHPVEPDSAEANILTLVDVLLLDDQGNELSFQPSGGFYYQTPFPMQYAVPTFTYEPEYPTAGQVVLFNASGSVDPDSNLTRALAAGNASLTWNFDDGTVITTNETVVTHIFSQPRTHNVTLTVVDEQGLESETFELVEVGFYTSIEIEIETGEVYYPGEITEFYILTSQVGRALNVDFQELMLYFNGTQFADLSTLTQTVSGGFYRIPYTIPGDSQTGIYTLLVEAEFANVTNRNIASFQISETLVSLNNTIINIDGNVAEILTQINEIRSFDLAEINANLLSLNNTVAIISTTLGSLTTHIDNINLTVTQIEGDVALIQTSLGTIQGQITTIDGNIVIISTDIGDVQTDISEVQDTASEVQDTASEISGSVGGLTNLLYATLILALIAALGAILVVFKTWKK